MMRVVVGTALVLLGTCARTGEAFGGHQQPSGDQSRSSSTAAKASATLAPVSTATRSTTAASRNNKQEHDDMLHRYHLEPLDNSDIFRSPIQPTSRAEQSTHAGTYQRSTAAASSSSSSPTGGYLGSMTSRTASSSTVAAAPKKSHGPGSNSNTAEGNYKPVTNTGFNGFLSELSSSSPATADVDSPTKSLADHRASTVVSSVNKSALDASSRTRHDDAQSDLASSGSVSRQPAKADDSSTATTHNNQFTGNDARSRANNVMDANAASRQRESRSLTEFPRTMTTTPSVRPLDVRNDKRQVLIPPSSHTLSQFPAPPLDDTREKDRRLKSASPTKADFGNFPAPPLPIVSPEPETRASVKTLNYAHEPVGMVPAPTFPLPYEEPDARETARPTEPDHTTSNVRPRPLEPDTKPISLPSRRDSTRSSYFGIGGGREVSGSSGMSYIPRSDVFGLGSAGAPTDGERRVIASSSSDNVEVSISSQGDLASQSERQPRRFEDRFNALIQGNTERARKAKEASLRRSQAIQTLAKNTQERKQARRISLGRETTRAHKAPAALIADMTDPTPVQGGSLKTWSFRNPALERIHVALKTGGRPLNAELNLWRGPDDVPFKMRVYCENGLERPFSAVIEAPHGSNTVSVRNSGQLEFPLAAHVVGEEDDRVASSLPSAMSSKFDSKAMTVHGGALKTYIFDASVESVQVLLRTDGLPINATIELLQGPTNSKQSVHVYSEEGSSRPLFMIIETPGNGNVVRIVNAGPIEFPLISSVEPYSIGQALSPTEPVISGDVIHDEHDPDDTSPGFARRLFNYGRSKWARA